MNWRDALHYKAIVITLGKGNTTLGFKVIWCLYSADIWIGKFPVVKFVLGVNVVIWLIWLRSIIE